MSITVGDTLTPFRVNPVSPEAMKDWAVFLADPNPIHLDPEVVKAKGLGDRVINQGPANVAYIINMLNLAFPGAQIETLDSRFMDNVYGGDNAETFGTVTSITETDGVSRVSCDIGLRIEGRGDVISGTATVILAK
jgi:acyl dehydratase